MARASVSTCAAVMLLLGATVSAQDNFKPLAGFSNYPGYLFYYMERPTPHRIEMRVAPEGVVRGFSLKLEFPAVEGKPGLIFRELGRKDGTSFADYEGFSVWVKGDGSDAKGAVVLGYSSGPTATFPLKDANWHRVDVKWADFTPACDPKKTDIVFADWNMPNMSGVEFVRQVRAMGETEHIPIVMVTSERTISRIEEALDSAGANTFISKPFTVEYMRRKIGPVVRALLAE